MMMVVARVSARMGDEDGYVTGAARGEYVPSEHVPSELVPSVS
jgi:hypothetical protein